MSEVTLKDPKRLHSLAKEGCPDPVLYYWLKSSDSSDDKELLDMIIRAIAENGQVRDYFFIVDDAKVEEKYKDLTKKLIARSKNNVDLAYLYALLDDYEKVNDLLKKEVIIC